MKTERGIRKIWVISGLVLLLLCLSFMLDGPVMTGAKAATEKNEGNTGLGTGGIKNPSYWGGGWSYVYFGQYEDNPVKYRVLDKQSGDFSVEGGSMLLDCDSALIHFPFNTTEQPDAQGHPANDWEYSTARWTLKAYYESNAVFTSGERAAIALSRKARKASGDGQGSSHFSFAPLTGDHVFLLDHTEASRKSYGYCDRKGGDTTSLPSYTRPKGNSKSLWILRSPYHYISTDPSEESYAYDEDGNPIELSPEDIEHLNERCEGKYVATVSNSHGKIMGYMVNSPEMWISPALNVSLNRILFTTKVPGMEQTFTMTLLDSNLSAAVTQGQQITQSGNTVTVPYTVTGEPNRISVLITTTEYNNGGSIRYYRSLEISGNTGSSGVGTFTFPDNLAATDRIYIVAEKVYGDQQTDYAGTPYEIFLPNHTVTFDGNGGSVVFRQIPTGSNCKLPFLSPAIRDKFYLAGWFSAPDGGEEITLNTVFDADQTVYAHWVPTWTITLDANGGSVSPSKIYADIQHKLTNLPTPDYAKHIFTGWFTAPEGGEKITPDTVFDADQTVYAHWVPTWTIMLDAKGGSISPAEIYTDIHHKLANLPTPDYAKHIFTGWFTAPEGGEKITTDTVFDADQTIYAHWIPQYTITLNAGDGNASPAQRLTDQSGKIGSLPVLTHEGYAFTGWFTKADGGEEITTDTVFDADQTIYAHWYRYRILTLDANGGSVDPVTVPTDADRKAALPNPTRSGYKFLGWFTAPEGGEQITADTVFDTNQTLYAHWSLYYEDLSGRQHMMDPGSYTMIREDSTRWDSGWYAVAGQVSIKGRITVSGEINLILGDGAELTAVAGIHVPSGASLTIWGQSENSGVLSASAGDDIIFSNNAAIGGNDRGGAGAITINGGTVKASSNGNGAAIGNGGYGQNSYITINGGNVQASTSDVGAAIGNGEAGSSCNITITGGSIKASTYDSGAAIGGGRYSSYDTITINGGSIQASTSKSAAAIGCGVYSTDNTITINGGIVHASASGAGAHGAAIGGSHHDACGNITIRGGQVYTTNDYDFSSGIGPGYYGTPGTITLGWTDLNDVISASSIIADTYVLESPFVFIRDGQDCGEVTPENLATKDKDFSLAPAKPNAGIAIEGGDRSIPVYLEGELTATVADPGEGTGVFTWKSDNPSVAVVDLHTGKVVPMSMGITKITAVYTSDTTRGQASILLTVTDGYTVTASAAGEGTVTVSDEKPMPGDTITVTVTPADGILFDSLAVTCGEQAIETVKADETTYTFVMPYGDVTVAAAFREPERYLVYFVNLDGRTLQWHYYPEGSDPPVYEGDTPTFGPTPQSNFTFAGWDREITAVTGDATYRATYTTEPRSYSVTFVNRDGESVLYTENVEWGQMPEYLGDTPEWPTDENAVYTFRGWKPKITPVRGEAVYRADFDEYRLLKTGNNTVSLQEWQPVSCGFTPAESGFYHFSTEPDPAFASLQIFDGEERIAAAETYTTDGENYVTDCAVELTQGKEYTVKLMSVSGDAQLTLNIENADQYTITIVNDENEEHGILTDSYPEGITYAGKTVHVDWEAEEGYRLKELIVTTEDGRRVESAFSDFRMPSSNVTVSARFGKQYPVTISYPEGIYPEVTVGGLMCTPDDARAMEGETVTMYIHWFNGYIPESITVVAAGGEEIPAGVYREEQNGCICCRFTMPEEAVNVSITAVQSDWQTADFILPAAVTRIEENAFEGADMHVVYIPDSCLSIGAHAFQNCGRLTNIRIPEECEIGEGAFDGCGRMFVFGTAGSPADLYCRAHDNCTFAEE